MTNADRAQPDKGANPAPVPNLGDDLISPADLNKITEEREMAMLREAQERDQKHQKEQDSIRDAFMHQHIRPDAKERFTRAVSDAAARGVKEIQITRFPASYCTDGGRAINNFEPDWPKTLTGFAREAYEIYERHLKPKGYRMQAQILNYPGGMPGDVGLTLSW